MRGLKKAVVGLIVMMSGLCSAEIEERFQVKNESTFLDNLSFYGAGERVNDLTYKGVGLKYETNFSDVILEKGDDYQKGSWVQRIDINPMVYTKLGLGYLKREELIYDILQDVNQNTYGISLGYGDNDNYNIEFGYIENELHDAGAANTTTKIWYTEGVLKQTLGAFGTIDAIGSYQNAQAYGKYLSDHTISTSYYPMDDIKIGVKYNSIEHDSDNYRLMFGISYEYDGFGNFLKGIYAPRVSFTRRTTKLIASDTTPDAFNFSDRYGIDRSISYNTNTITVSGIDSATTISTTAGTLYINGSASGTSGTVNNGDTVKVNLLTSHLYETSVTATVTIGSVSDSFSFVTISEYNECLNYYDPIGCSYLY